MADSDRVELTDLDVFSRYSLAVRTATADRGELIATLRADLDWLSRPRSRSAARGTRATGVAEVEVADAADDDDAEGAFEEGVDQDEFVDHGEVEPAGDDDEDGDEDEESGDWAAHEGPVAAPAARRAKRAQSTRTSARPPRKTTTANKTAAASPAATRSSAGRSSSKKTAATRTSAATKRTAKSTAKKPIAKKATPARATSSRAAAKKVATKRAAPARAATRKSTSTARKASATSRASGRQPGRR